MKQLDASRFETRDDARRFRKSALERLLTILLWVVAGWAAVVALCVSSFTIGNLLFKVFGPP